jgi:hypothetical protein
VLIRAEQQFAERLIAFIVQNRIGEEGKTASGRSFQIKDHYLVCSGFPPRNGQIERSLQLDTPEAAKRKAVDKYLNFTELPGIQESIGRHIYRECSWVKAHAYAVHFRELDHSHLLQQITSEELPK